jgi:Tn3 transposase DDE domain
LSALGLVVNALILWTTRYMDAALDHLRATGADVKKEDLARLSPLSHKHFKLLGRYHFAVPEEVLRGELRPLRILRKLTKTCRSLSATFRSIALHVTKRKKTYVKEREPVGEV